jgi:Sec7-like guanine-nucleotide exchange factor
MNPPATFSEPFRANVLRCYLDHFDFSQQPLDEAFRNLCAKLFFKAESQQMDRIIEAFAKRYWDCNPTALYHSAGKSIAVRWEYS